MDKEELVKKLDELIAGLIYDYDRFSESGKQTYREICNVMEQLMGG